MKQLVEKIVVFQINKEIIRDDEKEKYIYAYMIFMEQLINIFFALSVGYITENMSYIISFLVAYICLRAFGGGYHAGTVRQCCIFSTGIIILICILKNCNFINEKLLNISLYICNIIIILLAPVDSKNKLLDKVEKKRNRRKTIIALILEYIIIMFFVYTDKKNIYWGMKIAILLFAIFLAIGKAINNIERMRNCE